MTKIKSKISDDVEVVTRGILREELNTELDKRFKAFKIDLRDEFATKKD